MKVLINAISARQGGILTYTRNLMRSLESRGIEAVFAVPDDFEAVSNCRLIRISAGRLPPLMRLLWEQTVWRYIVMREKPDLLFSSANFGLLFSSAPQMLLIREGGVFDPFYLVNFTVEQGVKLGIMRRLRRMLMLKSAEHCDLVMTPTEGLRTNVLRWNPALAPSVISNFYGTLEQKFHTSDCRRSWCADGTLRVLYVSIYYVHKNPSTLVRGLRILREQGIDVMGRITMSLEEIAGTIGGIQDHLWVKAAVADGLVKLGRQSYTDLPDLYRDNDIFVFPSVCETFGHPMVEALASGVPMVVAEHPVNREICADAALYFSPFSPSELADRLRQLDQNPQLRETLARRGRERVLRHFTWDAHVERLCGLFEKVATARLSA